MHERNQHKKHFSPLETVQTIDALCDGHRTFLGNLEPQFHLKTHGQETNPHAITAINLITGIHEGASFDSTAISHGMGSAAFPKTEKDLAFAQTQILSATGAILSYAFGGSLGKEGSKKVQIEGLFLPSTIYETLYPDRAQLLRIRNDIPVNTLVTHPELNSMVQSLLRK